MISLRRASLVVRTVTSALLLCGCAPTWADDVDALDRQLLDALEERPPADSPQQLVPRLIKSTKQTAQRLQEGRLDAETTALQKQILEDIDALLKQSAPPDRRSPSSGSPSDQTSDDTSASQEQETSPEESQTPADGAPDPNEASKESQQRSTPGEEGTVVRGTRLGLSTSAWGHLPPKVREQMRSAFSEEYLPEYDALVRRYYEALARRRSAERDRRNGK